MNAPSNEHGGLGPAVVQLLLPHRPPLLLVDRILGWSFAETPTLRAARMIAEDEEVFRGHFPGRPIWPGIYTIEGLGQSTQLLATLAMIRDHVGALGGDADQALHALAFIESSDPGEVAAAIRQALGAPRAIGMSAGVDIRLLEPVRPGDRLEYRVAITHRVGDALRSEVEASVGRRVVARGSLTSAIVTPPRGR